MSSENQCIKAFEDLPLSEPLFCALKALGHETPTPIQALTIPLLLEGLDVMGQAQTGTGKTAAFALPFLCRLDLALRRPQLLVLLPTRELAIQVATAFREYAAHLKGFAVLPIYGGQDYATQLRALKRGPQVVVGTPGRVMDHLRRGSLRLDGLTGLVLDEADEMLRMGFIDDVEWILEQAPAERQMALFSATLPPPIRRIAAKYLKNPRQISLESGPTAATTIRQRHWLVSGLNKLDALCRILEAEPIDGVIVFVNTKVATVELADQLSARGLKAAALNGDMIQRQREQTIERLKNGQLNILVATDVAARGLDVSRVSHVLNYDLPADVGSYVHRIGRTGRAGRSGEAIAFVPPRMMYLVHLIERSTRQRMPAMSLPSVDGINSKRIARFGIRVKDALAGQDLSMYRQVVEQILGEQEIAPLDLAAALASLAQGGAPLLLKDAPPPPAFAPRSRPLDAPVERKSRARPAESGMERFRIEVGLRHGATPRHIVGAIANEIDLDSEHIGRIDIFDDFSVVDLPEGMPGEVFHTLQRVFVCRQPLRISRLGAAQPLPGPRSAPVNRSARDQSPGQRRDALRQRRAS